MKIVPDANIIVSSLITDKGNPAKIIKLWKAGTVEVLTSQAILEEISRVTAYPRILQKNPRVNRQREQFLKQYRNHTTFVKPKTTLSIIKNDESDNRYLECAVAGSAQYIISGDEHLLGLKKHKGIYIVTPAGFISSFSCN